MIFIWYTNQKYYKWDTISKMNNYLLFLNQIKFQMINHPLKKSVKTYAHVNLFIEMFQFYTTF